MTPAIWASSAVAVVSLIVSVCTAIVTQRMKTQSDRLLAEDKARRDYEYEARRRLYSEFEPLQFRMVELCEVAYFRATSFVDAIRSGRLADRYAANWQSDPYAMLATVYELMAPVALYKIARSKLTLSDLNLDESIRRQHLLAKELYTVWHSGKELAASPPTVPYDDNYYDSRQVPLGRFLDELLSALIDPEKDAPDVIEFRVYYKRAERGEIPELAHLTTPFTEFNPARKRVLWRAVVASAHICRAMIEYSTGNPTHPARAIPEADLPRFRWPDADAADGPAEDDLTAVRRYLQERSHGW